ncbi:AraC family transcriptional regulator [Streptomyces sp. WAC 06725]|uniref:AraC family transcriptional regulator n=1 Tax=Streptomyces sp. WAC 06725 TaxID=2203209 RepID=UPI000F738DF8|nr:helix-turn-helix transcriptional regulator [Streptomyces sp. WAC 06725]RSO31698.1 AraC family transcriptional regulator [Streptomyces sp. WAC 06725]
MPVFRHHPSHVTTITRFLPQGAEVTAHHHDVHQIVYAGRGVLTVTTDAGSWVAPATRAIWIPAGTVHEHRAHGDTDLHTVGVPVDTNPLGLDRPAVLAVGPLLRELIIAYSGPGSRRTVEARRLLAVLLDQLRHAPLQALHLPTPRDPRLVAVCAMLRADPADPRPLAGLGAAAGASERTLARLFRAELGMTFPQWRTQLRLHHALVLLTRDDPALSVTAIAHRCGWASASAFIDAFRRSFGHTPGAHRDLYGATAPGTAAGRTRSRRPRSASPSATRS